MTIAPQLHRAHRSHRSDRPHPLERLSWAERIRGAGQRRSTRHALDALQLRILRAMAADRAMVSAIRSGDPVASARSEQDIAPRRVRAVELDVGERRVRGRVCAEAEASLAEAIHSGPVRLGAAARYGPYWTLTFRTALEALIVLADRVVLLPASGGVPGDVRVPGLLVGG